MTFTAFDADGAVLRERTYYSVGGGFVVDEEAAGADRIKPDTTPVRYPFLTGVDAAGAVRRGGGFDLRRDARQRAVLALRGRGRAGLLHIWRVMQECVERGCRTGGVLPGGLKVRRRAAELKRQLEHGARPVTRCGSWTG